MTLFSGVLVKCFTSISAKNGFQRLSRGARARGSRADRKNSHGEHHLPQQPASVTIERGYRLASTHSAPMRRHPSRCTIGPGVHCSRNGPPPLMVPNLLLRVVAVFLLMRCAAAQGQPTTQPSTQPTQQPTLQPSTQPSMQPSTQPSTQPTQQPTLQPSTQPTAQPSKQPASLPTSQPSRQPSSQPSKQPAGQPSGQPSAQVC